MHIVNKLGYCFFIRFNRIPSDNEVQHLEGVGDGNVAGARGAKWFVLHSIFKWIKKWGVNLGWPQDMKSIFEVEQTGHVERKQGAIYFGDSVCQMPQKKKFLP